MAKLYFRYGTMSSGKTTALLQAAYNYEERGMPVVMLKADVDTKGGTHVVSRLGLERKVDAMVGANDSITQILTDSYAKQPFHCVLVDEAQFLSVSQIDELFWFTVEKEIPVLAYGLRTDFLTRGFPASARLLELAHELIELKTICRCGKKAVFNARKVDGVFVAEGSQLAIENYQDTEYEALCAIDYRKLVGAKA